MTTLYHRARKTRLTALGSGIAVAIGVSLFAAGCGTSASSSSGADSGTSGDASAATSGSTEATAPDTTAPVEGGTLTFAVANDPINLNPSGIGSGNDTWYVTRQIVDSLTEQDPATGEVIRGWRSPGRSATTPSPSPSRCARASPSPTAPR